MLKWDKPEVIDGLTVYRDERSWTSYYVLPSQPRYRLDDKKLPVFKFLKYRNPIDREDGRKGGGFLIFDVEFVVPEDKRESIRKTLQERVEQQWKRRRRTGKAPAVKIAQWNVLRGTTNVQFLDSGGAMVERIQNPGSPSLYGDFVTPITIELSPEGATLAEQALQDKGGVVQVALDLFVPVKLPPVTASVWFRAEKFMSFHQTIETDKDQFLFWGSDDYKETIRETFSQSDSGGVRIDPGGVTDQKMIGAVRDWAWSSLEQAVTRMVLGDIAAEDPAAAQKLINDEGFENVERDIQSKRIASFKRTYREGMVMEWNPAPRGTLPNITSLTDADGEPLKWEDYAREVDLDDEFFKTLAVNVRANADFEQLPLDSIEVKLEYEQGSEHAVDEFSLRKAEDVGKFESFIGNDSHEYEYSYQVNYKGASERYQSPTVKTDERMLTINVGDTGVLVAEVAPGDLNFDQVKEAQVTLTYEDAGQGVPKMEQVFRIDKEHTEHRWVRAIFKPRSEPIRYRVKYFMADGREFESAEVLTRSPQIFINDPFSASRTVNIRGFGDFESRIDTIFVDLSYEDAANGYRQSHSAVLNKGNTFFDWTFPVISEDSGELTYSANIRFIDGTVEEVPTTVAEEATIMLGDVQQQQPVRVMFDLIDLVATKLVKVSLTYTDEENGIEETDDIVFKEGAELEQVWVFPFKNKLKKQFTWKASYFGAGGEVKTVESRETTEETIVVPSRPA